LKYFAVNECDSVVSNDVTITVYQLPEMPSANSTQEFCEGATISNINATISQDDIDAGNTLTWYDDEENVITDFTVTLSNNDVYFVSQTDATTNCESLKTRIEIIVHPYATAEIISVDDLIVCTGSSPTLEATASGVTSPVFRWFDADGDFLAYGDTYPTGELTTTTTDSIYYYVSVKGDNYCENSVEDRKEVIVTVLQQPEVTITSDPIGGLCYPGTFKLYPEVTGLYGDEIQSFQWYIKQSDDTFITPGSENGIFSPPSGGKTDINGWSISYYPSNIDAIDNVITLELKINTGACDTISNTIELGLWPLPVDNEFEFVSEPIMPVSACEGAIYEFKVSATGQGGMKNIILELDDYIGTGISVIGAKYQHIATSTDWIEMDVDDSQLEHYYFSIPDPDFQLAGPINDFINIRVTVYPDCEFFSGGNFKFNLDASGACGTYTIEQKSLFTEVFEIDFDDEENELPEYDFISYLNISKGDNLENDNNDDRTFIVDNSMSKTITWTAKYTVTENQPNLDTDSIYFLIPLGMNLVDGSFASSHLGYAGIVPDTTYNDDKGIEYVIPFPVGLEANQEVTFSIDFSVEGTSCDYYDFYMEIIREAELTCGATSCTFYKTVAPSYFGLEVQWFEYEPKPTTGFGIMNGNNWSGEYKVKAITESFGGNSVSTVEIYIDENNNGVIDDDEQMVSTFERNIPAVPAGTEYTVEINPTEPIEAEIGKQLIILHTGDDLCEESTVMVSTLFGPDELCKGDIGLFTAPEGMNLYSFSVTSILGNQPAGIPLEDGEDESNARFRFDVADVYTVTLDYVLDKERVISVRRNVSVKDKPTIATISAPAAVCAGNPLSLSAPTVTAN
ncbi:hypothetical protein LJC30_06855, partial [Odoribacter sp. OttesenSCG-928-L07]|nr:hypothetical protein [Odoribacter sp. OttesenSCG-928-L07]